MAAYECRIFFSDSRLIWSETYYTIASSAGQAMAAFRPVAAARAQLNGTPVVVNRLRCAQLDPAGDVAVDGLRVATFPNAAADPDLALVCTVTSALQPGTPTYSATLYLRGLPQDFFNNQQLSPGTLGTSVQPGLNVLLVVLQQQGFRLRVASKATPRFKLQSIQQFALDDADCGGTPLSTQPLNPQECRLVCSGQLQSLVAELDASQTSTPRVCITGARWSTTVPGQPFDVNGVRFATYWDGGSVVVNGQLPSSGFLQKPGYVRYREYAYPKIGNLTAQRVTRRAVGGRSRNASTIAPSPIAIGAATAVPSPPPVQALTLPTQSPITQPIYTICNNARDVAVQCFLGYTPPPPAKGGAIRIYEVLNYPKLWLVTLSGTSIVQDQFTGFSQDITAGLNPLLPDLYLDSAFNHITATIPQNNYLILYGHSLGGMECQNLQSDLQGAGYTVFAIVTMGSPLTVMLHARTRTRRFWMKNDPVPLSTPLAALIAATGLLPLWYVNIDDPNYDFSFSLAHSSYELTPVMEQYDVLGDKIPAGTTPPFLALAQPAIYVPTWYYPPPSP